MKFYSSHPYVQGPCLRVYIPKKSREWIPITDIVSLEGDKGYTWLNWINGRRVSLPYTLKQFEVLLPATCFLRVHRRYLLNRQFIDHIDHEEGCYYMYMTVGAKMPISRRRLLLVEQELDLLGRYKAG